MNADLARTEKQSETLAIRNFLRTYTDVLWHISVE
jgi:hypothetical protein